MGPIRTTIIEGTDSGVFDLMTCDPGTLNAKFDAVLERVERETRMLNLIQSIADFRFPNGWRAEAQGDLVPGLLSDGMPIVRHN